MFAPDQYELLDFGDGRRLERFGELIVDRPAPAAERVSRESPDGWQAADYRFDRERRNWFPAAPPDDGWSVIHGRLRFELRRTGFGHVGLFPEQAANWDWLAAHVTAAPRPLRILNLFAYTGGSTLAAAAAGGSVVHVDSARNVITWARRNALRSGLESAAIRWICEDAHRFVRRELKRGNEYDAVILDPPSYGHGPHGKPWKLADGLGPLLTDLCRITTHGCGFVLVSCHTTGLTDTKLASILRNAFPSVPAETIGVQPLGLRTAGGRVLESGITARFTL